ncbi:hypothetical protein IAS59_001403 [Cryptococcus gattii]
MTYTSNSYSTSVGLNPLGTVVFTSQVRKIGYIPFILPVISVTLRTSLRRPRVSLWNIGLLDVSRALVTYIVIAVQVLTGEWSICRGKVPGVRIIQTNALYIRG